jgi:flagellar motor switch protein FliN/FliY
MAEPNSPEADEPRATEEGRSSEDPNLHESVGERAEDEPVVQNVEFPEFESEEGAGEAGSLERLLDVRLTLSVELGRRQLLVQEVLNLGQGSILDLQRSSAELVDVLINGKLIARGEVVVIDDNFGVRITSLVDPIERVKRLA